MPPFPSSPAATSVAHIAFLQDNPAFTHERPYLYLLPKSQDFPLYNCHFRSLPITSLLDCRNPTYRNELERNGFAFIHSPLQSLDLQGSATGAYPSDALLEYVAGS